MRFLSSVSRFTSSALSKPLSVASTPLHQSIRSLITNQTPKALSSIKHSAFYKPLSFTSSHFSSSSSSSSSSASSSGSSSSSTVYIPHEYEKNAQPSEPVSDHHLPHPIWDNYFVDKIDFWHHTPKDWVETLAYRMIKAVRFNFDWMSGYSFGRLNESKVLRRCIFLETVAGVPGSVAATMRHLASLRKMKSDGAWIHTLLEEAENERMHLLTFLELKEQSSRLFRVAVMFSQGIFYNFYFAAYLISPRFCHRVVGYLEEEATRTYTHILEEIENGSLQHWKTQPAPKRAMTYWKLPQGSTMRDVIRVIRADEAHHRDVNHTFAGLPADAENPFPPGK